MGIRTTKSNVEKALQSSGRGLLELCSGVRRWWLLGGIMALDGPDCCWNIVNTAQGEEQVVGVCGWEYLNTALSSQWLPWHPK